MKKSKLLSAMLCIALFSNSFITINIISAQAEEIDIAPTVSSEPNPDFTIIPNTLEQLVSKDGKFESNSIIYSDRYKFALEHDEHDEKENRDKLIVYGIPYEDTPGLSQAEWKNHLFIDPECTYIENSSMDGDDTCLIYSGKGYFSLAMQAPNCNFERPLDIMFCVIGQDTYFDASALSFDVSKYIYGVEYPKKTSENPPIINTGNTSTTAVTKTTPSETLEVSEYITTDEPEGTTMPADKTTTTTAATASTTTRPNTIKPITTSYLIDGIAPGEIEAHADDISLAPGETTVMKFSIPGKLGRYESCSGHIYLPEGLKCEKVTYGDGKEVNNIREILNGNETVYGFEMPETSVILTITADKKLTTGKYIVKCDAIKSYREPLNGDHSQLCVGGYRYADKEVEITVNGNDEENTNYISNEIASIYGDTDENGYVNIADLVKMNLYILNSEKYPLNKVQLANADCLRDNVINSGDSTLLMNYISELISADKLGKSF